MNNGCCSTRFLDAVVATDLHEPLTSRSNRRILVLADLGHERLGLLVTQTDQTAPISLVAVSCFDGPSNNSEPFARCCTNEETMKRRAFRAIFAARRLEANP
jgi:hypothetical protein